MTVLLGELGTTSNQIICHSLETEIKTLLKKSCCSFRTSFVSKILSFPEYIQGQYKEIKTNNKQLFIRIWAITTYLTFCVSFLKNPAQFWMCTDRRSVVAIQTKKPKLSHQLICTFSFPHYLSHAIWDYIEVQVTAICLELHFSSRSEKWFHKEYLNILKVHSVRTPEK